jgi:DNA polymerase III sliding clamp (beta) subunit (PCNA family)
MNNLKKYFEKIELAIKSIEGSYDKLLEAEKNIEIIRNLENEIIILKKEKVASLELIDQALQEIKLLRKNVTKDKGNNGGS